MFKEEYVRVSYRACLFVGGGALAHVLPASPDWNVGGAFVTSLCSSLTRTPSRGFGLSLCTTSLLGRGAGFAGGISGHSCRHEAGRAREASGVTVRSEMFVSRFEV